MLAPDMSPTLLHSIRINLPCLLCEKSLVLTNLDELLLRIGCAFPRITSRLDSLEEFGAQVHPFAFRLSRLQYVRGIG